MNATAREQADRCQTALDKICQWFNAKSMQPFDFQREAWDAYLAGQSGLIHARPESVKPTPHGSDHSSNG